MKKMIVSVFFWATVISVSGACMADSCAQVVPFVYERDVEDVLSIVRDDWHWLFNSLHPVYDREYVLQNLIPGKEFLDQENKKDLKMNVFREDGHVMGFATFYQEDVHVGRINLVSVAQDSRTKGLDRIVTAAAVNSLFDAGCTSVLLWTCKENEKVPMYESLGFLEEGLSEEIMLWFQEKGISADEYAKYTRYRVTQKTFIS